LARACALESPGVFGQHAAAMTSLGATLGEGALEVPRRRAWGAELAELLLVGGLTPLLFPLSYLLRMSCGLDEAELMVGFTMFWAAHVINDPHFSVSYLLFYENFRGRASGVEFARLQRARYLLVGLVVPLALVGWALWALQTRAVWSLGVMIQLMFLLVGWHYVKQAFGVLLVLCARRSVFFDARERAVILAHAYAGWAYAWASPADPGRALEEKGVPYVTFAHPAGLERLTQVVFFASFVALVVCLARKWRSARRADAGRAFTPLVAFASSIWLWSVYSGVDPLVRYAIPALHSLQYLYMVWLLKRNEAQEREGPPWFDKPVAAQLGRLALTALALGWLLFRGGPAALDGSLASADTTGVELGPTPYFAALYACVNIHHYCMDAVIWRKDNPSTRFLRRVGPSVGEQPAV